jgi:hypothetical protein
MFAVVGLICGLVAAILRLTNQHGNVVSWLVIIGVICACTELVWFWHRGGYYRRGGTPVA